MDVVAFLKAARHTEHTYVVYEWGLRSAHEESQDRCKAVKYKPLTHSPSSTALLSTLATPSDLFI